MVDMNDQPTTRYRKKPIEVEAIQYCGIYDDAIKDFLGTAPHRFDGSKGLEIATLEGVMLADRFDWIIRGVKGEYYPCKPDIFAATYEPAA
jgi:hypothetical protein